MTTPIESIDLDAIMPMSFVLKPPSMTEAKSQALQIAQGKREQDSSTDIVLRPGVYQLIYDWNSVAWRSLYLSQGGQSEKLVGAHGEVVEGRSLRFSVWDTQAKLTFFTTRGDESFDVNTRLSATIIPTPLANTF
ncbi:hypothetical protein VVR46_12445 [Corynebacterium phoceense]|uniref:hypothetical protein n=1 Tax=Corynebacterium phoceense TaxID=1686286 RepID=UPI0034CF0A4F